MKILNEEYFQQRIKELEYEIKRGDEMSKYFNFADRVDELKLLLASCYGGFLSRLL